MVFSSIPGYLDSSNWHHQQQSGDQSIRNNSVTSQLFPPAPPPPPPPSLPPHVVGSSSSIRPGSMADRARMANIPVPEGPLNCPRCESTNTKFCYFNNYSLSQPRHFCKTCRRYWTRGGALRSVPVGGGCRRNKRSKGSGTSSSKSPATSADRQTSTTSSTSTMSSMSNTADMLGLHHPQGLNPLRFMAPLHNLTDFNYTGIPAHFGANNDLNFQLGSALDGGGNGSGGNGNGSYILSAGGLLQQSQQLPFLGGLDPSQGLYPFEQSGYGAGTSHVRPRTTSSSGVKMEDNQELNLSRQFMGLSDGNEPYWSGGTGNSTAAWTDLSGFSSSSTTHPI